MAWHKVYQGNRLNLGERSKMIILSYFWPFLKWAIYHLVPRSFLGGTYLTIINNYFVNSWKPISTYSIGFYRFYQYPILHLHFFKHFLILSNCFLIILIILPLIFLPSLHYSELSPHLRQGVQCSLVPAILCWKKLFQPKLL